jgi:general L-amino acid transport system substrate-binding protein
MKRASIPFLLLWGTSALLLLVTPADAGDTLARVKARANVRCGVSDGILGFSLKGADGRWAGMDAEFCHALAAAVLGDPEKVNFVSLAASARFPSLIAGEIDVLVRNTTWTLEREATLEIMFTNTLFYDGQGFLVSAKSGVHELAQLNGAPICAVKGSTHEGNLAEYFLARGWTQQTMIVESQAKAAEALFSGHCQAFTSERPQLTAMRMKAPGGPEEYVMLPDQISKEPMGPVVRRGDDEWFTIVRWVLFVLIRAEEAGITRANVHSRLKAQSDIAAQRWREVDTTISKAMTVPPGWATRAVSSVGNYGEIFERNVGAQSPLKLERGLNRLWTQGGLMYAPPFH